jgi:hypothetical protein
MHDDDDLLADVGGFWAAAARGHDIIGVRAKSRLFALTPKSRQGKRPGQEFGRREFERARAVA